MELEGDNSSALESVDDNSSIQKSSINIGDDNESCSDESVKLVSNSSGGGGGSYSPIPKGQGLRKWRRIRRELVKETHSNNENITKVLKRGLPGVVANSRGGKQMHEVELDISQEEQGSVGSVNMFKDGFHILRRTAGYDNDSSFALGLGFSSDNNRNIKDSTATRVPKVENSKKHRGESVDLDKENSHSSLESDSRKFVDYSDEMNGETSKLKDKAGEESINKNGRFSEGLDPLAEAIDGFLALQEALDKEVEQFREIGKDLTPQHHEGDSEVNSEIVTLVKNIEQLEMKLEDTRSMLEVKESYIHELESTTTNQNKNSWGGGNETEVEDIFRQRIEADIEYLIYSRSIDNLNTQMKLVEEQEALAGKQADKMLNKLGRVQTKAANLANRAQELRNERVDTDGAIKKRACKTTTYFIIQLVLLLALAFFFISELFPEEYDTLVPT